MPTLSLPFLGHGGDYNPDQWLSRPDILEEDVRLMQKAGCNLMSVGIFSWAALEPEEGVYTFDWLEGVLNRLHAAGISVFLATPSGARPSWMSQKYPEVLRVRPDGGRNLHGGRHNHCFTSPVYREKVAKINEALARRFGHHPSVVGWHISNELSGECHCEMCQQAFRSFLKDRYGDLDALNAAWWTGFWSKTFTDWNQIHSPTPQGEDALLGLTLAWRRFVTYQTVDFVKAEMEPLRRLTPDLPVTTNLMCCFGGFDYQALAHQIDFTSYDSYPGWGVGPDEINAAEAAFNYDYMRCLKNRPFALMESTPSQVNWHDICKLKKPGMHLLSSLQAVAHGADTVQYFQWRQSRGGAEKFHGAVVSHEGSENTRTFHDVAEVGETLKKLQDVRGRMPAPKVAILYDQENRWALDRSEGPRRDKKYLETVIRHYAALKRRGVDVDVIDETCDLSSYALVDAPLLYMLRPGAAERLTRFVEQGGVLTATCMTGRVDEEDLCFLGGFPGPLRPLFGIWAEETDALTDSECNGARMEDGSVYDTHYYCDLIHAETARVLGTYTSDFYAGAPCVTENEYGRGLAVYVASLPGDELLDHLFSRLLSRAGVKPLVPDLPRGVWAASRGEYLFLMNFSGGEQCLSVPDGTELLSGRAVRGTVSLPATGAAVIRLTSC